MNKFHEFLVNYQGFYKIFRKMPIIIFWFIFAAGTIAGIAVGGEGGGFGAFLGFSIVGAIAGAILALLQGILISPIIIITDSKIEKK